MPKIPVTALDVFRFLPQGTRAEAINNVLYIYPSPFFRHQEIVSDLAGMIIPHVKKQKLGTFLVSPFDVYLEKLSSAVQPDLLFISNKNKGIIKSDGYAHGAPDLIIEVLSTREQNDRRLKKELYEKAGVKEYFIIDPKTKMTEAWSLKGKKYVLVYKKRKHFQSSLLNMEFTF